MCIRDSAKQFVCDDEVAAVGTINLDFRSLYLHFENGCWFYGCKAVQDVKADFDATFPVCTEVTSKYSVKGNLAPVSYTHLDVYKRQV